jgi:hypothetical protein
MYPPTAPHATCAIEALDDPLLLRIICATIDAASGGGAAVEEAQQALAAEARAGGDGADDDAWHPAHLARLACVSRCVT